MRWRQLIARSGAGLIVLMLSAYFLDQLYGIVWLPDVVVAWGTLVLAYATYELGRTTKNEGELQRKDNERLRQDDRKENERLRREEREVNRKLIEEERDHSFKKTELDRTFEWVRMVQEFALRAGPYKKIEQLFADTEKLIMFSYAASDRFFTSSIFGEVYSKEFDAVLGDIAKFREALSSVIGQLSSLDIANHSKLLSGDSTKKILDNPRIELYNAAGKFKATILSLKTILKI